MGVESKEDIMEKLQLAINDCENWEDWDRNDADNFQNIASNLSDVMEYIESKE